MNMKISSKGSAFIRQWEGLSLDVYKDVAGYPTIGYGHLIKKGENFTKITKDQAIDLFLKDLAPFEEAINTLVQKNLLQHEFDALVSFVYNIGQGAFSKSTLLKYLNEGNFLLAYPEFLRWNKAGGKEVQGLTNRRKAEQTLFVKGIYS